MMFSERLKSLREEKGFTQQDIADILGVGRATIAEYETKGKQPDYEKLIKLAGFFGTSVDYLLGISNIRNTSDEITNAVEDDPELFEFWNELKEREDLQLLFKQTKDLSPNGIKQIIRIIKAIEDEEDKEY
jgi:transcriptional regulator with XRE-family HTH domain